MGVHGLWKILEPAHRPIRLETLARKRLAVDASIWIYQFLKAVRDAEGNALHNSHIVGFFRRICKLLFHGIRPVFVFDGGAPVLKRQTITGRKLRREGRKEDAAQTAKKLLALQIKRRAEQDVERARGRPADAADQPDADPENYIYVDEIEQTPAQRQATEQQRTRQKYKKTDQYQLPEMEHDFSEFGAPDDARLLSVQELQEYAKQFEGMEDANFGDYSNIDFSSPFFAALPVADRYRIINQARLRSRLRMGYSKEQLDSMFPDRMAFSKFQIDRLVRRNELSQRLMNLQGRDENVKAGRVAGEKNKEYIFVRNEEKGGWVMEFVGNKEPEGVPNKPIDVEKLGQDTGEKAEETDEDVDFEDVPIEGLNRLPKAPPRPALPRELSNLRNEEAIQLRRALYESRLDQAGGHRKGRKEAKKPRKETNPDDALFLEMGGEDYEDPLFETEDLEKEDEFWETLARSLDHHEAQANEDARLQQAIAMSMGQDPAPNKGKGKAVETPENEPPQEDQAGKDFELAVSESLKTPVTKPGEIPRHGESSVSAATRAPAGLPGNLDLTKSRSFLFGKKSTKKSTLISLSKISTSAKALKEGTEEEEKPVPLPPWFTGGGKRDIMAEIEKSKEQTTKEQHEYHEQRMARKERELVEIVTSDEDSDVEFMDVDVGKAEAGKTDVGKAGFSDKGGHNLRNLTPHPNPPKEHAEPESKPAPTTTPGSGDEEIPWSDSEDEQVSARIPTPVPATSKGSENPPAAETTRPIPSPKSAKNAAVPGPISPIQLGLPSPKSTAPPSPIQPGRPSPMNPGTPPHDEIEEPDDFDFDFELEETPPPEEPAPEEIEEQELITQMSREVAEHARFAAEISHQQNTLDYERELQALRTQQKKDRRDADEVSQVMIQECQQLLALFGLPYITAPMEAEAQCAELVKLGLVDGIVTDDSDVFLFGGTRVYRHMFNDKQVVQCYLADDLEKEFALDQNRLIAAAQLLGSDYTDGVQHVGPVTAIELLAEFPDLTAFRNWWNRVQQDLDTPEESASRFRKKFKKSNVAKVFLPPSFPDPKVEQAYLHPEVDSDPSPFEWGVPGLEGLRSFLMNTLGWTGERTDQILVPVVQDMNKKMVEGGQVNITSYFGGTVGAGSFAPRDRALGGSKRMEQAMEKLKGRADGVEEVCEGGTKRPMSMRERFAGEEAEVEEEEEEEEEQPSKKKGRKAPAKTRAKRKAPAKRGKKKA